MSSSPSSLLLALTLGVFQVVSAAPAGLRAQAQTAVKAQVPTPPTKVPARAPSRKRAAGPASPKASPASKVRSGTTLKSKPTAVKDSKADCDTPPTREAIAKPIPVAADPLAPTVVPCAEPTRKP